MRASLASIALLAAVGCTPFSGIQTSDSDGGALPADAGSTDASAHADGNSIAPATVTFVQNLGVAHSTSTTATTLALTVGGDAAAADLLVARFATNTFSPTAVQVSDSIGDTWHLDADISSGGVGRNQVWSTRVGAGLNRGSQIVFSFGADTQPYSLVVDEFRGPELASQALAADTKGVVHVGATASSSTTDTLSVDASGRTQLLAIGVVFVATNGTYVDNPNDGGDPWQPLTADYVSGLGNHGAYKVYGAKADVTYAPLLGQPQNNVETIVVY
jgi:hypothetical protein